jgi:phytoene dehydrogenase-like protein
MNGYRAVIFELHDLPGGLCTDWERKGYTFDGCIHYLVYTDPDQLEAHLIELSWADEALIR